MFAFLSLMKDRSLMVRLPVSSAEFRRVRFRGLGFSFSNFLDNRREFASGAVFSNQVALFKAKTVSEIKITLKFSYETPVKVAFDQTKGNFKIKLTVTVTEVTQRQEFNIEKVTVQLIPKGKTGLTFNPSDSEIAMEDFKSPVEFKADFDMNNTEVEKEPMSLGADIKATVLTGLVLLNYS